MTENQIEKLERIKSLFESGTISKEEMENLKNGILSNQKNVEGSIVSFLDSQPFVIFNYVYIFYFINHVKIIIIIIILIKFN